MDVEVVEQVWWFTSRAAGIVAWVLLSGSVLLGLTQSSRASRNLPAGWTLDLHRFLSMLSIVFLSGHLAALVPDNFVHFGWAELFVPYASEWRPGAVAWGIVAFWLLVAVQITSLLRPRLPNRLWRRVHFLSFPVWVGATVHLLTAGTDADVVVFRVVQVVLIGAVVIFTGVRIVSARRRSSARALPIEEPVDVDQVDAGKG
jgi:predicted ferric reductase